MNLVSILIIFGITFFTGLVAFRLASKINNWIKYLLSFSGAYLFGLTITHLLPEMYEKIHDVPLIPIIILAGFFFQLILEQFSDGIEHGHIHVHDTSKFPIMLIIALLIHATMEGVLLNESNHFAHNHIENYLFGLSIHKIPIAIVLAILLRKYFKSTFKIILLLVLFALATPIGTFFSEMISEDYEIILLALVAGGFLHISTTILFESSPNHKFNAIKFIAAVLGASISCLI